MICQFIKQYPNRGEQGMMMILTCLISYVFSFFSHLPFAVVGSTEEVKVGNKMVKARQYPWGTVQGE